MKLDRDELNSGLGSDYALIGDDGPGRLEVQYLGKRIAWLDMNGTIDSWLLIKWREKPDGWKPYEQELGREELIDAELRPLWNARGFVVGREGTSSCWYPDESPLIPFPAVEVPMSVRVKGTQEAVSAIRLIATEHRDVWVEA
jgi:hypothetical protein